MINEDQSVPINEIYIRYKAKTSKDVTLVTVELTFAHKYTYVECRRSLPGSGMHSSQRRSCICWVSWWSTGQPAGQRAELRTLWATLPTPPLGTAQWKACTCNKTKPHCGSKPCSEALSSQKATPVYIQPLTGNLKRAHCRYMFLNVLKQSQCI